MLRILSKATGSYLLISPSEILPAKAPVTTATSPSTTFHPIVKYRVFDRFVPRRLGSTTKFHSYLQLNTSTSAKRRKHTCPAFVTKPPCSKKKRRTPWFAPFFNDRKCYRECSGVDAGNPLLLVSIGGLRSAIDKNTGYFQPWSRTCIRNPPLFFRHLKAIG